MHLSSLLLFFFFFWVKAFLSFSERRNRSIVGGEVEACSVGRKAEGELWSCNGPSEESGVPQSLAVRLCLVRESTREMTKEEKVNISEAGGLPFAVSQSTKSSTAAGFPPSYASGLFRGDSQVGNSTREFVGNFFTDGNQEAAAPCDHLGLGVAVKNCVVTTY